MNPESGCVGHIMRPITVALAVAKGLWACVWAGVLALAMWPSPAAAAGRHPATPLPLRPPACSCEVVWLIAANDNGQAVGTWQSVANGPEGGQALAWDTLTGPPRVLTLPSPFFFFYPRAINQQGVIVGSAEVPDRHAVLVPVAGPPVDLGTLGGSYSYANDINAAGQVVGEARTATGAQHAFLWTSQGGMQDLGTLGGVDSVATAINAAGHVVGYSLTAAGDTHAFYWTAAGGMVDLGTLGGSTSQAFDINIHDVVVGESRAASGRLQAFLWSPATGLQDLVSADDESFSSAKAINDANAVVGRVLAVDGGPFLWTPANGLVLLGQNNLSAEASGITNDNLVFGTLTRSGPYAHSTAFLFGTPALWQWSSDDLLIDYGLYGLWRYSAQGVPWVGLHNLNPLSLLTADVDANGIQDVVVSFGPPAGLWLWLNRSSWVPLHNLAPSRAVATNLDLVPGDELVFDFPGAGLWRWSPQAGWAMLHPMNTLALVAARGQNGGFFATFRGFGVWRHIPGTFWTQVDARDATILVEASDGDPEPRLIMGIPGAGIWQRRNEVVYPPPPGSPTTVITTTQLHPFDAKTIVMGDFDGLGPDDLVIDFGPTYGLWTLNNFAAWAPLHGFTAAGLAAADLDGLGRDEIVVNFGPYGLWRHSQREGWLQLNNWLIEGVVPAILH